MDKHISISFFGPQDILSCPLGTLVVLSRNVATIQRNLLTSAGLNIETILLYNYPELIPSDNANAFYLIPFMLQPNYCQSSRLITYKATP